MQRIVKFSSLQKVVNFKVQLLEKETRVKDEQSNTGQNMKAVLDSNSRNISTPSCTTELTFGSMMQPYIDGVTTDTSSSRTESPSSHVEITHHSEEITKVVTSKFCPTPLNCGHESSNFTSCTICLQKYCQEQCLYMNDCSHLTCKNCMLKCFNCTNHTCVQCMIRCSECLNKLCGKGCGGKCTKCGSEICLNCLKLKQIVNPAQESYLCMQCTSEILQGSAQGIKRDGIEKADINCDWKVVFTTESRPSFIQQSSGQCFSLKGKYIGKFI